MTDMEIASKHAVEGGDLFLEWPTIKDMLVEVEVTDDDSSSDEDKVGNKQASASRLATLGM